MSPFKTYRVDVTCVIVKVSQFKTYRRNDNCIVYQYEKVKDSK